MESHSNRYKKALKYDLSNVVGVVGSHAHADHMKCAKDVMASGIDVFTGRETINALNLSGHRIHEAKPLEQFSIGDFTILPFSIEHDREGLGYLIQHRPDGFKILFATDTYYIRYKFRNLNTIMIECNYIKETLDWNIENGYVNEAMKPRLLQSHFSLENVKKFLQANDLSQCRKNRFIAFVLQQ